MKARNADVKYGRFSVCLLYDGCIALLCDERSGGLHGGLCIFVCYSMIINLVCDISDRELQCSLGDFESFLTSNYSSKQTSSVPKRVSLSWCRWEESAVLQLLDMIRALKQAESEYSITE